VLRASDVPSAPVLDPDETVVDPQVVHNAIIENHDHPVAGRTRITRPPAQLSATPAAVRRHAPSFGEHTDEVLVGLGLADEEIAQLRDEGVVA